MRETIPINNLAYKTRIEIEFLLRLRQIKIEQLKQSIQSIQVVAKIETSSNKTMLLLDESSFDTNNTGYNKVKGNVVVYNTEKDLLKILKKETLKEKTDKIIENIEKKNNLMEEFYVYLFIDLKKYLVKYTTLWPSLQLKTNKAKIKELNYAEYEKLMETIVKTNKKYTFVDGLTGEEIPVNSGYDLDSNSLCLGFEIRNVLSYFEMKFNKVTIVHNHKILQIEFDNPEASKTQSDTTNKISGWELDQNNKLSFKTVDLSSLIDPIKLAKQANELNIRLMKWRQAPSLNIDLILETRVAIVGMGTLGCNVARSLLGWNITNITLVDCGLVSASNPVRQALFDYKDKNKHKSKCAAEKLRQINPSINVVGLVLEVPMPGHFVENNSKEFNNSCSELDKVIRASDVVFLCTDSRESRWLPTLLCSVYDKIAINCALGFDTFLVMRHGNRGNELGCYFCNDVVVPTDSLSSRPIDEQCTISRSGLSFVSSGLGVELLIQILNHADNKNADCSNTQGLGMVPHIIRGSLHNFETYKMSGKKYTHCTACSERIAQAYKEEGTAFVEKVVNNPKILSQISGIDSSIDLENILESVQIGEDDDW